MSLLTSFSFLPDCGYPVPLDDFRPGPAPVRDRPAHRDRPLGELVGLVEVTRLAPRDDVTGLHLLDSINLSIRRGEILGVIGPERRERAALVRCINLLERPNAGEIVYEGEVVQDRSGEKLVQLRRKIGMLFQSPNLLRSRSAFDNLALPLRLARRTAWEVANRVPLLLDLVGLAGRGETFPDRLSPEEKRRLGLARALALQPELLLCEDPTAALDPEAAQRILDLLKKVNRELGLSILFTTDDMGAIRATCDRLAVLERGRIVEAGPVWESFAYPRTALTRRLVQSILPELPAFIRARLTPTPKGGSDAVLRLQFGGSLAFEPVIAQFAREQDAIFSVIYGTIDYIQEQPLGILFLALQSDEPAHLRRLVVHLRSRVLDVEVLGYVSRSA